MKMEAQKKKFVMDKVTQPSKYKTKSWVEINSDVCGAYSTNN